MDVHISIILFVWSALAIYRYPSVIGLTDQSLQLAATNDGQAVCAVDEADQEFSKLDYSNANTCIPSAVQCGWKCRRNPNCTRFNYRQDSQICQLYFRRPSCFLPLENCLHFQNGTFAFHPSSSPLDIPPITVNLMIPTFSIPSVVTSVNCWIVFDQRVTTAFNFNRTWSEYKTGFGDPTADFWMGLEKIYQLTNSGQYKLRIELHRSDNGQWLVAEYNNFYLDNETSNYKIHVSGYVQGGYGDVMNSPNGNTNRIQNGMSFTTFDRDNDNDASDTPYNNNCATKWGGGGWYKFCCFFSFHGRNTSYGYFLRVYNTTIGSIYYKLSGGRMLMTRIG